MLNFFYRCGRAATLPQTVIGKTLSCFRKKFGWVFYW